jgi:TPR repeat protein
MTFAAMFRRTALESLVLAVALFSGLAAQAAPFPPPPEPSLAQELQDARWPADIVLIGDRYLASYPYGPFAATARAEVERARNTKRLLERSDIRLYRGDFLARDASPTLYEEVRKAALADKEAAGRIARLYRDGDGGIPAHASRYVGWLQYAAALGNAPASYELALYYRKSDQPALAAPYEARAEELGFQAPPTLDNVRK